VWILKMSKRRRNYWDDIQGWGKRYVPNGTFANLGGAAGMALGSSYGLGNAGRDIGRWGGNMISSIAGFGDYTIRQNSLMTGDVDMGTPIPSFGDLQQGTVIRHREFVKDIAIPSAPATFTLESFVVNPGNATLFPWLSGIARQYQEYRLRGCVIQFISTADGGSTATTLGLGSLIMASDYNPGDFSYANKQQMEASQYCISSRPTQSLIHPLECDPSITRSPIKYVRNGDTLPTGTVASDYDHCNFEIATVGLPTGSSGNIGELWVTYDIELLKPQHSISGYYFDKFNLGASISASNYLSNVIGTAETPQAGSTIGGTITTSTYTFPTNAPGGIYYAVYCVHGASTTLTNAMGATYSSNLTAIAHFNQVGTDTSTFNVTAGAVALKQIHVLAVRLTPTTSAATILLTTGTLPGTITAGDFFIFKIPELVLDT